MHRIRHTIFLLTRMQQQRFPIIGVGASAGGHMALQEFFSAIPAGIEAGFVVITHLLRNHHTQLPKIIAGYTDMPVVRISSGTNVMPGTVYVMPENVELTIRNGGLILHQRSSEKVINAAIDVFFRSLAADQGPNSVGVVLSGLGTDGSSGAVEIYQAGGEVYVQDPSTTIFSGMPISAILKDHPSEISSPRQLATTLVKRLKAAEMRASGYSSGTPDAG